jgi:hypothetical protein
MDINQTNNEDGFDLKNLENKLNTPTETITTDPTDNITDTSKPAYVSKKKSDPLSNINSSELTAEQIRVEIKKAFTQKKNVNIDTPIDSKLNLNQRKALALGDISQLLAQEKVTSRTWLPRIRNILPADLYGKINAAIPELTGISSADVATQTQLLVKNIGKIQSTIADQFIRTKSDDLIRDRVGIFKHRENITILNQILNQTRRTTNFFDTTFKKYLMSSLELKFKHIFVSQDILKHTKLLIDTIAIKLDSVKHNTSLSDVAKLSVFGEFSRTMRLKGSSMIVDATLSSIKGPVTNIINEITGRLKEKTLDKYQEFTESSPVDTGAETEADTGKFSKFSKEIVRGIKLPESFFAPDMTKVINTSGQNKLNDIISSASKLVKGHDTDNGVIQTLDSRATDKASFDEITRRSIIEIIPGFLSKIHQQSTIIANTVKILTKGVVPDSDIRSAADVEELRFDRTKEDFVSTSEFDENLKTKIFGTEEQRTTNIQPIVSKFYAGFTKHGGSKDDFKEVLPDMISFITNISKHTKVVKLGHIVKYLKGEKLSDFEQSYLDAVFVDIPKKSRKRLAEVIVKTSFKDPEFKEVDTDVVKDVGSALNKLIGIKKEEHDRIIKASKLGDMRNLSDIRDKDTGALKHSAIRKIQSDVDFDELAEKDYGTAKRENYEEAKAAAKNAVNERLNKIAKIISKLSSDATSRFGTFKKPFNKNDIDDLSEDTGIPNRDAPQISGPGMYYQGSEQELHIPLDKLGQKIKDKFNSIISGTKAKTSDLSKTLSEHTEAIKALIAERLSKREEYQPKQRPTPVYNERVDIKSEPWRPQTPQQDETVETLKDVKTVLENSFQSQQEFNNAQFQQFNQILAELSTIKDGESSKQKVGMFDQFIKRPISFGVTVGKKVASGYLKGLGKFYGGLFNVSRKVIGKSISTDPSIDKGLFNLGTKAGGLAKGAFNVGKMMFSSKDKYVDVYRKDEIEIDSPLMKGMLIRAGQYIDVDGKPIKDSYSINGPVFDSKTEQIVISADDLKHGLVDKDNNPLTEGTSVLGLGGKLLKKTFSLYGSLLKGSFKVNKGMLGFTKDIITGVLSNIPGLSWMSSKKSKKGEGNFVDTKSINELVTQHLVTIINLLRPISEQTKGLREGSYADYKRDREAETSGKAKKVRARDLRKEKEPAKGSILNKATKDFGLLGMLGSFFGLGGGDEEGGGSGGLLSTIGGTLAGGYALNKAKNFIGGLFGKKAVAEGVEAVASTGAKAAVKKGILSKAGGVLGKIGGKKAAIAMTLATALGSNLFSSKNAEAATKIKTPQTSPDYLGSVQAPDKTTVQTPDVKANEVIKGEGPKGILDKITDFINPADDKDNIAVSVAKDVGSAMILDKAKDFLVNTFFKKGTETVANQGIKAGARVAASNLGRLAFGQGIRTAAIAGGEALAAAVGSPVVLAGLAIAGLGAGGYALWQWNKGKDRRESITKIRNVCYHVPDDKLKVIIRFEDDLAKAMQDQQKSELINSKVREYITDFGLDPDDKRQFTFFKHWYITMFFPVFKASYDIFSSEFKVEFTDQTKLTDDQLNAYKKSIEDSPIYQALKEIKFDLSPVGFSIWEKEKYFKDGEYTDTEQTQKDLDKRLEESAKLIADNKSISKLGFEEAEKKAKLKAASPWDNFGMPGVTPEFNLPTKEETLSKGGGKSNIPEKSLEEYAKSFGKGGDGGIIKDSKGRVSQSKTWKNAEPQIIEQLIRLGWSKDQAIGIAANIHGESAGNHTAVGDGGKAYGIAQWHPDRQNLFAKKFGKDIRQSTLAEQVAFVDYELNNGGSLERKAGRLIRQSNSAEEAAALFTRWFERPADIPGESSKRAAFASAIKKNYTDLDTDKLLSDSDKQDIQGKPVIDKEQTEKANEAITTAEVPTGKPKEVKAAQEDAAWGAYGMPSISTEDNLPQAQKANAQIAGGGEQSFFSKTKAKVSSFFSGAKEDFGEGFAAGSGLDTAGNLGDAVAKYESGNKGVASISSGKGDPGGASYGKYQLASKTGTLQRYLKDSGYAEAFSGMNPGQPDFNNKWKELATSDPNFAKSQHDFIKKTHFDPAIKKAAQAGFDIKDKGIQEAIWSASIQHGGVGRIIAKTSNIPGFKEMSAKDQIVAFYKTRGDYASSAMRANGAAESVIQNASYGRYSREIKDVLALSGTGDNVTAPSPTIPSPAVNQQPIENTAMADIQGKDIKAGMSTNPVASATPVMTPTPSTPPANVAATTNTLVKTSTAESTPSTPASTGDTGVKPAVTPTANATSAVSPTPVADTYINKFIESRNQTPSIIPSATANISNAIKPEITPPMVTPQSPVVPEVTVVDPEGKNQTSLLSEQNKLLSQVVQLLSGDQSKAENVKADNQGVVDNTAVVQKLDQLINTITATNGKSQSSVATSPISHDIGFSKRAVSLDPRYNSGIDVSRNKAS